MARFITIDRDTAYLLPPSVQEWLPERHLARFVVDVVNQLDLSKFESAYAGRFTAADGAPADRNERTDPDHATDGQRFLQPDQRRSL